MSKENSVLNKDNTLNSRVKSHLNEKRIKKIRKILQTLTEMDIKSSKSYIVKVIKKTENENVMAMPTIIPKKNYNENLKGVKQNVINIEDEICLKEPEMADSSDFENEDDE